MTPREQILKMQRIILRQLKENVKRLQGPETGELSKYQASYQREFRSYQKISSKKELVKSIQNADVVFGADFHPFIQSQKTHLRLLREVIKTNRPVILALESVGTKYQVHIDNYLAGKIKDKEFLKRIHYFEEWGFPWENYKILFDFAKENKIKVYGINHYFNKNKKNDLLLRDSHSARNISDIKTQNPEAIVYVLYGDLHLAHSRLPRLTKKILKGNKHKFLTIFQNSEKIYWKLASRKLEEKVDVIKLRADTYCVVNAPPWMKWQSYLQFLEKKFEHEDVSDPGDQITQFAELLTQLLEINKTPQFKNLEDFHFFQRGDMGLARLLTSQTNLREKKLIEKLLKTEKSFFVPRVNILYFVKADINHIASLVGKYVHSKFRREKNITWTLPQDFSALIWVEAMGFFMSKIINNRRKQRSVKHLQPNQQATLIVLEQRLREKVAISTNKKIMKVRAHRARRIWHYIEASGMLGGILGQKIYDAFIQGHLDLPRLRSWLRMKVFGNNHFHIFYLHALKEISRLDLKQVKPEERL